MFRLPQRLPPVWQPILMIDVDAPNRWGLGMTSFAVALTKADERIFEVQRSRTFFT